MVTSALSKQLRFPSQGSDRQLPVEIYFPEGTPVQAKADVPTGPGTRHFRILPDGTIIRVVTLADGRVTLIQMAGDQIGRGNIRRPIEEVRNQWRIRRERGIVGQRMEEYAREEVSLRDQIREWEQDEQRKMEQERQATSGIRRNLDHLKRGDQQPIETETGRGMKSDHPWELTTDRC
jgi:hypothetical protein